MMKRLGGPGLVTNNNALKTIQITLQLNSNGHHTYKTHVLHLKKMLYLPPPTKKITEKYLLLNFQLQLVLVPTMSLIVL